MIDIKDVPAARSLWKARRAADIALLVEIARATGGPTRIWRRGWLIGTASVCAVAACGTASAMIFLPARPATVHNAARCYTRASKDFGPSFPGTTIAEATSSPETRPADEAAQAVGVCSALWRQGFLRPGGVTAARPAPGTNDPVPRLVACVLPSGEAAVFPGTRHTCAHLGLPPMSR